MTGLIVWTAVVIALYATVMIVRERDKTVVKLVSLNDR